MKQLKYLLFATLALALFGCSEKKDILITVNQYVYHPNLEKTYKGFQDVVNEWAAENKKTVKYDFQVANGEVPLAAQIARQQVLKKPNLMLTLGTPSAQASKQATNKIPIIFGAVTDPVKAELVKSMELPDCNVTGSSDQWPYEEQFKFLRTILPTAKRIGVVLNPSESNTEASMKMIKSVIGKYDFEIIEAPVASTSEIFSAANSLVGKCDVFFAPADNTVLSGLEAFVRVSRQSRIPLFVGDEGSVEKGGIATVGINYYELGRETGKLAVEVLKGNDISKLSVVTGSSGNLIVNKEAMEFFNLEIPEEYKNNVVVK
jgi:putative ABC transport system substrate-binding protein